MKSKSKFKIIISAVLAISVVFSTFAFLNASAEENDAYGTYEDGISGNYAAIQKIPATNGFKNSDFSEGLRYWGKHENGTANTSIIKIEEENGNKYINVKTTGYGAVYSVAFSLDGVTAGDYLALRFRAKSDIQNGKIRTWLYRDAYANNNCAVYNSSLELASEWKSYVITSAPQAVGNYTGTVDENKNKICLGVYFSGAGETQDFCIDDVEVVRMQKDVAGKFFACSDLEGNYKYNNIGDPLYGTENDGILLATGNTNAVNQRLISLDVIPALDKVENFDFSNGLVNFGPMNRTSRKNSLQDDGVTLVTDGTNKILKICGVGGSNTDKIYGFRSIFFKLADSAKGKEIFLKANIKTDIQVRAAIVEDNKNISQAPNGSDFKNVAYNTEDAFKSTITSLKTIASSTEAISVYVRQQKYGNQLFDVGTSYIDDMYIYYIDEGGLDLPASIDGTPIDYALGDVNADGSVNICDLVAMNKKKTDSSKNIYYAAAKLDGTTVATITDTDISSMRSMLLNK